MFRKILVGAKRRGGSPLGHRALSDNVIVKSRFKMPWSSPDKPELTKSLPQYLLETVPDSGLDSTALVDGTDASKEYSFSGLKQSTTSLAASLLHLGVGHGDVVGILSPNNINYFTAFHGVGLTGAASTTINPTYTEEEIEYQLGITESKCIIVHPSQLDKIAPIVKKRKLLVITLGDEAPDIEGGGLMIGDLLKDTVSLESLPKVSPESLMTIPFSSGTTGKPKGVMLTHKNLVCNTMQSMVLEGNNLKNDGVLLIPLPFFHIYGMMVGLCVPVAARAKTVLMPQFDLEKYLEIIQLHKVTRSAIVPPIILGLAKHPVVDNYDLSSLKGIMSGAAPLGSEIQKQCAQRLGCIVKQAWGMTEISPCGAITPDEECGDIDFILGKSGLLAPMTEAKIVDTENGEDLPFTSEGELMIRGPQVMKGYFKNEEATKNTIRPDGWMHTGDIAKFDRDGWLIITDRSKELIKYKGLQVAPAELEALIGSMKSVKDCVVIPVLDDEAGELPRAYVVKQDDEESQKLTAGEVAEYVKSKVAQHKRLRGGVKFTNEIPKSASGKILRRVQIQIDRGEK